MNVREWAEKGVVLDGAMGTLLEDEGVDVRTALWGSGALLDAEGRALTASAHGRYVEAGAELIIANTHNASLRYVERFLGETERWPESAKGPEPALALMRRLNADAMAAAREAVEGTSAKVAGCLASPDVPYARVPSLDAEEVAAALAPQVAALAGLEPDLLLFEMCTTGPDLDGVAAVAADLDVAIGVGLVCGEDGRLLGGVTVGEAVARLAAARPAALFVQCTAWDLVDRPLGALLEAAPSAVVGAYGNDGRGYDGRGWTGDRILPERYAEAAAGWWKLGARAVGGCCGTGPAHIAEIRRRVDALRASPPTSPSR